MPNRKIIVGALIVLVVVAAAIFYFYGRPFGTNDAAKTKTPAVAKLGSTLIPEAEGQKTVEVTVKVTGNKFSPSTITVPAESRVLLTLVNLGGSLHDLTVVSKDLSFGTSPLAQNQEMTVSFIAPKTPQTLEFYCSLYDNKANGMTGKLVIQ